MSSNNQHTPTPSHLHEQHNLNHDYENFEYPSYELDDDGLDYATDYVSNYVPNPKFQQTHIDNLNQDSPSSSHNSFAVAAYHAQEAAHKRKKAGIVMAIFAVLLLAIIIASAIFAFYAHQQMKAHNEVNEKIEQTIAALARTDKAIVDMDKLLNKPVDSASLNDMKQHISQVDKTNAALLDAEKLKSGLGPESVALSEEQQRVVNALNDSIAGRKDMVKLGSEILQQDIVFSDIRAHLSNTYGKIVEADAKVREALGKAKEYAQQQKAQADAQLKAAQNSRKKSEEHADTTLSAQSIVDLDIQALEALKLAKSELETAKSLLPELDTTAVLSYIEAKTKAVTLLQELDTAIAENKVKDADAKVKSYNDADAEVKPFAEALPSSPEAVFEALYQQRVAHIHNAYFAARNKVAAADGIIRQYQGVKTKNLGFDSSDVSTPSVAPSVTQAVQAQTKR